MAVLSTTSPPPSRGGNSANRTKAAEPNGQTNALIVGADPCVCPYIGTQRADTLHRLPATDSEIQAFLISQ